MDSRDLADPLLPADGGRAASLLLLKQRGVFLVPLRHQKMVAPSLGPLCRGSGPETLIADRARPSGHCPEWKGSQLFLLLVRGHR